MTHTPGPWTANLKYRSWRIIPDCDDEAEIASLGCWGDQFTKEQAANARLIAAAPELLEALKDCATVLEGHPTFQFTLEQAKQALAKAEGKP